MVHCSGAKKGDVRERRKGFTGGSHTRGLRSGGFGTARVHRGKRPQSVLWARCGGGSCGTIALSRDYSTLQTCSSITGAGSFKILLSSSRLETRIKECIRVESILVEKPIMRNESKYDRRGEEPWHIVPVRIFLKDLSEINSDTTRKMMILTRRG